MEIWKDIKGYEGLYQISNLGNVRSLDKYVNYKNIKQRLIKGKIIKPIDSGNGYMRVSLSNKNNAKAYSIHRLVAEAFMPDKSNFKSMPDEDRSKVNLDDLEVNHKNEFEKWNNRVDNLEWCTRGYNANYGTGNERRIKKNKKIILQYDLKGNFIREWDSMTDVEKQTKTSKGHICQVCKGKRNKAGNYIWKYKD